MGREIRGRHTLANIDPQDYIELANRVGQNVVGMCFYDDPFFYRDHQGQARRLDFRIRSRADLVQVFVGDLERLAPDFSLLDR